jgi:acyl dehydratase
MAAPEVRFWEDVAVGDEIGFGEEFDTQRLVVWASASGDFYQIHYDEEFARKNNLPGVIVHGALKGMIVGRMLHEWAGERGRVVHWDVSYRGMDPARQELAFWGRVTRTYQQDGEGRVDLDVGVRTPDGRESTPGAATVALPLRG